MIEMPPKMKASNANREPDNHITFTFPHGDEYEGPGVYSLEFHKIVPNGYGRIKYLSWPSMLDSSRWIISEGHIMTVSIGKDERKQPILSYRWCGLFVGLKRVDDQKLYQLTMRTHHKNGKLLSLNCLTYRVNDSFEEAVLIKAVSYLSSSHPEHSSQIESGEGLSYTLNDDGSIVVYTGELVKINTDFLYDGTGMLRVCWPDSRFLLHMGKFKEGQAYGDGLQYCIDAGSSCFYAIDGHFVKGRMDGFGSHLLGLKKNSSEWQHSVGQWIQGIRRGPHRFTSQTAIEDGYLYDEQGTLINRPILRSYFNGENAIIQNFSFVNENEQLFMTINPGKPIYYQLWDAFIQESNFFEFLATVSYLDFLKLAFKQISFLTVTELQKRLRQYGLYQMDEACLSLSGGKIQNTSMVPDYVLSEMSSYYLKYCFQQMEKFISVHQINLPLHQCLRLLEEYVQDINHFNRYTELLDLFGEDEKLQLLDALTQKGLNAQQRKENFKKLIVELILPWVFKRVELIVEARQHQYELEYGDQYPQFLPDDFKLIDNILKDVKKFKLLTEVVSAEEKSVIAAFDASFKELSDFNTKKMTILSQKLECLEQLFCEHRAGLDSFELMKEVLLSEDRTRDNLISKRDFEFSKFIEQMLLKRQSLIGKRQSCARFNLEKESDLISEMWVRRHELVIDEQIQWDVLQRLHANELSPLLLQSMESMFEREVKERALICNQEEEFSLQVIKNNEIGLQSITINHLNYVLSLFADYPNTYIVGGAVVSLVRNQPLQPLQDIDVVLGVANLSRVRLPDDFIKSAKVPGLFTAYRTIPGLGDRCLIEVMVVQSHYSGRAFIWEDHFRRDFTIGAMYYRDEQIIDPTQKGLVDARTKILDTVHRSDENVAHQLREDPNRFFRAVKFILRGYTATDSLKRVIQSTQISNISLQQMDHIRVILEKHLRTFPCLDYVKELISLGLLVKFFQIQEKDPQMALDLLVKRLQEIKASMQTTNIITPLRAYSVYPEVPPQQQPLPSFLKPRDIFVVG